MKIANFREYVAVLREIYTQEAMGEMGRYYYALQTSGSELKKKKAALQKEIYRLTKLIKEQEERIRVAEDKKAAGLEMKAFRQQKQQQVRLLKDLQDSNHFNILSEDTKVNVCSGFLLQKYLSRELLENNPLHFPTNAQGDLVVDVNLLRQSDIFYEAEHLRDFVAAYVAHNPEKVKTPGYFKTLLDGVKDWKSLLAFANAYFDKMNDNAFLREGVIKASRQGCETIKIWPEQGLQLVRLHTAEALDYESDKMKHCVGNGGYDKGVLSGKTHIYSLRDMSDEGEWQPHVTIEYTENKVKQIKGYKNRTVGAEYRPCIREAVAAICGSDDFSELSKDKYSLVCKTLGYLEDETGKLHDVTDMRENAVFPYLSIDDLPQSDDFLPLITVKELMCSAIDENTAARLKKLKAVGRLTCYDSFCADYRLLRNVVTAVFGSLKPEELSDRIDRKLWKAMGYVKEYMPKEEYQKRTGHDASLCLFDDCQGDVWYDRTHLEKVITVQELPNGGTLWSDTDWAHLICKKLEVGENFTPEDLRQMLKLAGCFVIHFDKTDFSQNETVDLSGLMRMYEKRPETREFYAPMWTDGWFKEEEAIVHWVGGRAVIFDDCRNLPAGDKIMFPPEIAHIVLGANPVAKDYVKQTLPDFSVYKQLESLQINRFDLSENEVIRLPENLKYLAFYKCKFGEGQVMDLSRFKQLEVLRVSGSDLNEVENYVFPESLKIFVAKNGKFKKGIAWDFSGCPNLKKLDLSNASFANLKSLRFPEDCVFEQKNLNVPDSAVIERTGIPVRPINERLFRAMHTQGIRIADAH